MQIFRGSLGKRGGFTLSNRGFTLIDVTITSAILGFAILIGFAIFVYYQKSESQMRRSAQVDTILLANAAILQQISQEEVIGICRAKGALNLTPASRCVASGGGLAALSPSSTGDLEGRYDWGGARDSSGLVCIEVASCMEIGDGALLDVTLKATWLRPGGPDLQVRPFKLRKAR